MHADRAKVRLTLAALLMTLPAIGLAQSGAAKAEPAAPAAGGNATPAAPGIGDTAFPTYTLEIEPSAWYVAPGGKGQIPGSSSRQRFEDLNLDSPRFSPQIEARFRAGKWGVEASGMHFEISDRNATQSSGGTLGDVSFSAGDSLSSDFKFTSIELMGSYQFFGEALSFREDGKRKFGYSVQGLLGGRFYDVEQKVTSATTSDKGDGTWIEPVAGARLELEFHQAFTLDVRTDFGYLPAGDKESFSWDIAVGGTYRPFENFGVQIGYRQLLVRLRDGDGAGRYEFDGAMAGVFVGASLRF